MANQNLKNALQTNGLTPEEFADIIRVDPKSVLRWLAGTAKPYPRHRANIARALDLTEHELWPDQTPTPAADAAAHVAPGASSEVTGTWAYTTDGTAPHPAAFISNSAGTIDLLDNGRGIELTNAIVASLVEQANAGRHIRLLASAPGPQLGPLIGNDHIEVRVTDGFVNHSLLRVGDSALLTLSLPGEADQPPPFLKLDRTAYGGLFDRLTENLATLWDEAEQTLTHPGQLDAYLTNTDDDLNEEASPRAEQDGRPDPAPTQRRWPRRPD